MCFRSSISDSSCAAASFLPVNLSSSSSYLRSTSWSFSDESGSSRGYIDADDHLERDHFAQLDNPSDGPLLLWTVLRHTNQPTLLMKIVLHAWTYRDLAVRLSDTYCLRESALAVFGFLSHVKQRASPIRVFLLTSISFGPERAPSRPRVVCLS